MRMSLGKAGRHHCGVPHLRPSWVVCNGTGLTHGMHAPRSVRHKYGEPAQFCSISITAFCGRHNSTLQCRFCLWISSRVSRPNAKVTRVGRFPDDVTYNDLPPRMLCTVQSSRCRR
jgi:hypothetical protein